MTFVKEKYPDDWPEIRARILRRAGGEEADPRIGARCEECGIQNYTVVNREMNINVVEDLRSYADAQAIKKRALNQHKLTIVVLTIAHINDDKMDCRDNNLLALCQREHLNRDRHKHSKNARATWYRKKYKGQGELFSAT